MPVSIQSLEISLGSFHLGPISAQFENSGIYLIRGKNGAGKTTFLRTLIGRIRKKSGEVHGLEFPIGTVGMENLLMGSWTVEENFKWLSQLIRPTTYLTLKCPDLSHFAAHRVDQLSQGMKRQVELSLMLSFQLPTLFLDEPLSPLDRSQREIYSKKIKAAATKSLILLTTHFEEELFGKPAGILEF